MKRVAVLMALAMCVAGAAVTAGAEEHPGGTGQQAATPPLFTQCPPVGADTGCGTLVTITAGGTATTEADPNQPPYDLVEDQLVGIQNNFRSAICSITLSSNTGLFGFDGDGLCTASPQPAGCPFGSTGYEGPGTSFSVVDSNNGTIIFTPCLAPGKSAYFSLEESGLGDVTFPVINTGSSPAPAMGPIAIGFLGVGLAVAGVVRARRRQA